MLPQQRRSSLLCASMLGSLGLLLTATAALAQTAPGGSDAGTLATIGPDADPRSETGADAEKYLDRASVEAPADPTASGDEIVVTAPSGGRGAARVEAEYDIGAAEIEIHAADTIDGLMEALSARTGTARPIILVNGERVPGGGGIGSYPPEAIERVQVLPPEAAAAYGYPPGQQLVNIILKRNFASWTLQGDAGGSTAGGRGTYAGTLSRILIAGNSRWSFTARGGLETMLRESERSIAAAAASSFGFTGNVRSAVPGAEIDPALSAAAGFPVIVAVVPSGLSSAPAIGDFVAGANAPVVAAEAPYRSLLPQSRSLGLAASLARPLGRFQSSLQFGLDYRASESLLGLPTASLFVAGDNGFSPFAGDVIVDRAWDAPLRSRQTNFTLNAGAGLTGDLGAWQVGIGTNYAFSLARSRIDRGADLAGLQDAIGGGATNPFALSYLALAGDVSRTAGHNASFNMNAARKLAELPAGALRFSLGAEAGASRTDTRFEDGRRDFRQRRESLSGRIALIVPLNSGEAGPLPALGGMTMQLSAGGDAASGEALRHQYSYGLNWAPAAGVDVSAVVNRATTPPDQALLSAPLTETPNVRVYDFVTGERVDIVRVDGGNPALRPATASSFNLRLGLRPAFLTGFFFLGEYRSNETRDGIGTLPALTAAVEAAFPERIERDPGGHLLRVDGRPINIARATTKSIRSNISCQLPLGGGAGEDGEGDNGAAAGRERVRGDGESAPVREGGRAGALRPGRGAAAGSGFGRGRGSSGGGSNLLVSLVHDWNLVDRVLLRPGLAPLDRLAGDSGTSAPRHSVTGSIKLNVKGMGLGIDARWASGSVARSDGVDGAPGTRLDFSGKTEIGLRLFGSLARFGGGLDDAAWAKGLRISLDVDNLFDARVRVRDQDGAVPLGFTRDELDPLGRTVKLSVRKML